MVFVLFFIAFSVMCLIQAWYDISWFRVFIFISLLVGLQYHWKFAIYLYQRTIVLEAMYYEMFLTPIMRRNL